MNNIFESHSNPEIFLSYAIADDVARSLVATVDYVNWYFLPVSLYTDA